MKRMRCMFAVSLFLAASAMAAREITVEMWDYYRTTWDGASLGVSVNGVLSNAAKNEGLNKDYFRFDADTGDEVIFYWHKGDDDWECAFAVYYTDEPPSKSFNPDPGQSGNDIDALLLYRLYNELAPVSEGARLGSFTVAPPKPVITVSPQNTALSIGGTRQFSATVRNSDDQTVTWSVSGNAHSGTVISADGVLTVSPDETAEALTVKAASSANPAVYGTAAVKVNHIYTIGTAAELAAFADSVNSGAAFGDRLVLLTGDIDLSGYGAQFNGGKGWIPIGRAGSRFRGGFDGGGHVIRNLYIDDAERDYAGLFGYIDTAGSVRNLGLENVNIRSGLCVGGIVGNMKISNDNAGGLTNCYVTGSVSGSQYVGGIVGEISGGSDNADRLTGCYFFGSAGGSQYVGGIIGRMSGKNGVSRCYSAAEVAGSNYIGGIAGSTEGNISYCAALNSSVIGNNYAGRVTGSAGASAALSANAAFSNMLNRAGNRNWSNKGPAAIDGEDIPPADVRADGTIGGRFAGSPWVTENGKLPGHGAAADMPEHIAEFYLLIYVVLSKYGTASDNTEQTVRAGADGSAVAVTEKFGYTFAGWSDGSTDNPRQDTNVSGDITVTAYFTDEEGNIVSVLSPERVIPAPPKEESTVIPPITILAGEFAAGPNPISKQPGSVNSVRRGGNLPPAVNFFRQGKRINNSELRVYDATGNVINSIRINDNALNSQAKRIVGKWDLTDKKGKLVSEGTYLVKGVIKTSDGNSENVSLILGVRR